MLDSAITELYVLYQAYFGEGDVGCLKSRHEICPKFYTAVFSGIFLHCQFHLISTIIVIKAQKMSENGEIYTIGKNVTLPSAVTAVTNLTSAQRW